MADSIPPRAEHPRPQFFRERWINLNGEWTFNFDFGKSGKDRGLAASTGFEDRILVPFPPESELSGVGYTDFIDDMWYHRSFVIPQDWSASRVLLHFGAVDYEAEVYVDGVFIGRHVGGSSSFTFDLSGVVIPEQAHNLVVHVTDDPRGGVQTCGKQSVDFHSAGCLYTRVTGIWQTVWLEAVPPFFLESCHFIPHIRPDAGFWAIPQLNSSIPHCSVHIEVREAEGKVEASASGLALSGSPIHVPVPGARLWWPEDPSLYTLRIEVRDPDGALIESVESYLGIRTVHTEREQILLNGEPLYLRLVLDQGYYPDGIWTAPSDEALRRDIELGLAAGFNGARLHQKVFEERYHYWADRLGYLTWGEAPNWGMDLAHDAAARNYLCEWREVVLRDRSHPSIIAWTPLNETWDLSDRKRHRRLHLEAYELTRMLDPTRPVNGASGGCQVKTDLYCVHIYEQDPVQLSQRLSFAEDGKVFSTLGAEEAAYEGQPYIVDEFGGIRWVSERSSADTRSWGYGADPESLEEFYERLEGQVAAILGHTHISGFCYTQLTDVEQEQNGLYHFDRSPKFDLARIRSIIQQSGPMSGIMQEPVRLL